MMRRAGDNETPEQRFERLATLRTNAVLDRLRILGNLSNRQMYSYSEDDVAKIFSVINERVRETRAKFRFPNKERFKL
jgi:hypothetical protein